MSQADEIERLFALHQKGALTLAEFEQAKAGLLSLGPRPPRPGLRGLRRSDEDSVLMGVCGGLGEATSLPSWFWRLLFAVPVLGPSLVPELATLLGLGNFKNALSGAIVLLYFVLGFALPEPLEPPEEKTEPEERPTPPRAGPPPAAPPA